MKIFVLVFVSLVNFGFASDWDDGWDAGYYPGFKDGQEDVCKERENFID